MTTKVANGNWRAHVALTIPGVLAMEELTACCLRQLARAANNGFDGDNCWWMLLGGKLLFLLVQTKGAKGKAEVLGLQHLWQRL